MEGILKGEFDEMANTFDIVWDVKTCVNVLLLWIWKYYKEGRYVFDSFISDL